MSTDGQTQAERNSIQYCSQCFVCITTYLLGWMVKQPQEEKSLVGLDYEYWVLCALGNSQMERANGDWIYRDFVERT